MALSFNFETTMWHQIKSYLIFLLKSKNQHGVHSPFAYDLITKCFYDSKKYSEYKILKAYRDKVVQSNEIINITDYGAGSRVFKSNERKVSAIAKNAGTTLKKQQLLFRLAGYFKPKQILELGTSLGLGTMPLAIANSASKITTIEGCPNTSKRTQGFLDELNLNNIHLINETFEDFFKASSSEKYDFIFIDGDHSKEHTIQYFEFLLDKINNHSVLIFDDIHWNSKMTEAWQQIIMHPKVTVSIDTYFWGFVFFRKEQEKEHFTIRV